LFSLLKGLHQEGQTILHVTHNYEEALVLATHIGVIHKGKIIQTGTAEEVFHRPGSEFVARFTGIKNYFPASLGTRSGKKIARLKNKMEIRIISGEPDGEGYVLIPGEEIILASERFESSATNQFKATVKEVFNAPNGMEILLDAGVQFYANITKESFQTLALDPGKEVWFAFKASGVRFIRT
jgi:molybdopterin-binding protein